MKTAVIIIIVEFVLIFIRIWIEKLMISSLQEDEEYVENAPYRKYKRVMIGYVRMAITIITITYSMFACYYLISDLERMVEINMKGIR